MFTLYLIQHFHIFNSIINSVLLSNFTFSSHSTVQHIQQCHKFNCIIYFHYHISINSPNNIQQCHKFSFTIQFHILISFNSPTHSTVSQIQIFYLVLHSHLIQQFHIFNHVTNSTVLSRFTFSSISKVYKFTSLIWFHCLISFNSPTYSKVSQIQLYYLISQSHLIQQLQIFNLLKNEVLLSNFTFISHSTVPHIQQCHKFIYFISFYILISFNSSIYSTMWQIQLFYLVLHSHLFQKCTNSLVLFDSTV